MKILLSAYACEPGKGSEPEVGFRTLLAAAKQGHEVWALTRHNNLPSLKHFLDGHPLEKQIHLVGHDVPGHLLRLKKRHRIFGLMYYDTWQKSVGTVADNLNQDVGFDVAHHVTFAAYWMRTGIANISAPLVWGPVGGGVTTPVQMYGQLGYKGMLDELARSSIRPLYAMTPRIKRPQFTAKAILAQNPETAGRIASEMRPTVLPNALSVDLPESAIPKDRTPTVMAISRLEPWKGVHLTIQAFAAAQIRGHRLVIVGQGDEFPRLKKLADDMGVADAVDFKGWMAREDVLALVAGARVLVHAALHEEAGLAVSEALSYGTPVLCLDRGGPPVLASMWKDVPSKVVKAGLSVTDTVDELAKSLSRMLHEQSLPTGLYTPRQSFEQILADTYETASRQR